MAPCSEPPKSCSSSSSRSESSSSATASVEAPGNPELLAEWETEATAFLAAGSIRVYRTYLDRFLATGEPSTRAAVARFLYQPGVRGGVAPATILLRCAALRSWFRFLVDRGELERDPTAGLRRPRKRPVRPAVALETSDQVAELLAAVRDNAGLTAWIWTALLTGLRYAELAQLRPRVLFPVNSTVHYIVRVKGGRARRHELPAEALTAIARYLESRGLSLHTAPRDEPFFPWPNDTLRKRIRRVAVAAGLPPLGCHSFRHTGALLRLEARPGKLRELSAWLGHANIATTDTYIRTRLGEDDPLAAEIAAAVHAARKGPHRIEPAVSEPGVLQASQAGRAPRAASAPGRQDRRHSQLGRR